jgi:D-threo-aldose 1-dehydrogenase
MNDMSNVFSTRGGARIPFGRLGLGTAPLGNMHRALSEAEAYEAIDAAWNCGVRYFDTAPLYGHGLSESRLGGALRDHKGFVVSTKVGRLLEPCGAGDEASGIYVDTPQVRVRFDYSYDGVMRSLEDSLTRLGVDRVDVVYVHDVDSRTHGGRAQSEARIRELMDHGGWRALSDLRASGALSAIGAGVNEWQPCKRLLEVADPDVFLLAGRYTLLEQEPLDTLFPACAKRGVGIVIGGAFNSGVLAGRPSYDYTSVPSHVAERVKAIASVCAAFDVPLVAAALSFPLAHPIVACVLAGSQTGAEARLNASYLEVETPPALWQALKDGGLIDGDAPVPIRRPECLNGERAPC